MSNEFTTSLEIRPFLNRPAIAYELCLIRSDGQKLYDRRIAILSGTDATDMCLACPSITFHRSS